MQYDTNALSQERACVLMQGCNNAPMSQGNDVFLHGRFNA